MNSQAEHIPEQAKPPSTKMILALTLIATISGFLIVFSYYLTLPRITENKRIALGKAIAEILPGTVSNSKFLLIQGDKIVKADEVPGKTPGVRIFKGLDETGRHTGLVIEAAGSGFQDIIRLIYAYDPVTQKITGLKVMESKETPGLGDKIESDPAFKENFRALDVSLGGNDSRPLHKIIAVARGKKTRPWEVDGITGATISSRAVARILNSSAGRVLPVVRRNLVLLGAGDAAKKAKEPKEVQE